MKNQIYKILEALKSKAFAWRDGFDRAWKPRYQVLHCHCLEQNGRPSVVPSPVSGGFTVTRKKEKKDQKTPEIDRVDTKMYRFVSPAKKHGFFQLFGKSIPLNPEGGIHTTALSISSN